jgi:hypothetical protein
MNDIDKDQQELEAYIEEKSRKPKYVEQVQPEIAIPGILVVEKGNLAIRILKSIGVGIMFFFICLPALPLVAVVWFLVTLFGGMFFPHFPMIIWVPFSIILFISPFLIGFVCEFDDLMDD